MINDQIRAAVPPTNLAHFSFTRTLAARQMSLHSRTLMLVLSHVIEDAAASAPQTVLVATFQRFSLMLPQLARYTHITPLLAHTYIIGLPDVAPPTLPNTTFLAIDATWPLLHEWVVMALGPTCCAGLFAQDVDEQQPQHRTRAFQGVWTLQTDVVSAAYTAFGAAVEQQLPTIVPDTRATYETTRNLQQTMTARLRQHKHRRASR